MSAYRLFFPHQYCPDDVSEPVEAATPEDACRILSAMTWDGVTPWGASARLQSLQVFINGRWQWVR